MIPDNHPFIQKVVHHILDKDGIVPMLCTGTIPGAFHCRWWYAGDFKEAHFYEWELRLANV